MARIVNEAEFAARRSEILAAAQRLIYSCGYEQMTIQDILDELKISKGAFYHYFDSKPALLEALIERTRQEAGELIAPILQDRSLPPLVRLERLFDSMARWKAARREFMLAILQAWYKPENAVVRQRTTAATIEMVAPLLAEAIRDGIAQGVFHTPYPEQAAGIAFALQISLGDTIAQSLLSGQPPPQVLEKMRQALAAYTDALERLLGAPPGSIRLIDPALLSVWVADA
jgi:AcrR family transcriptional regulator